MSEDGSAILNRAYSFLQVKDVNGDKRIITGTATTPTPDRMGDIVEPLGVTFKNPLPLLLYHNSQKPVGWVKFAKPTKDGIQFEASLPRVEEAGAVRDRIEEAWTSIKTGLLAGVSIGFRALEEAFNKETNGIRFLKSEVLELSLVAIPAHPDARIATIKSLDIGLAASGTKTEIEPVQPKTSTGVSVTARVGKSPPQGRSMKKSIADQISQFEASRQAKSARMTELMETAGEAGETLDAAQTEEYDGLEADVKSIDAHLVRLNALEQTNKEAAKPISGNTPDEAAAARAGRVITVRETLPPGIKFARYAMCLASANGSRSEALAIAEKRYPDNKDIHLVLRAAVAAGTTTDSTWAGSLVQYQDFGGDFVEYLRPQTILGKFGTNGIPALRRVPFKTRIATQSVGGSASWVGEGLPKPLTKAGFTTITMDFNKVATISVLTQEEVRFSNPSAEAKVRDDLTAAVVARIDQDFTDPTNAGTANVKPASVTYGLAAVAATGTDADHLRDDFAVLMGKFVTANISPTAGVLIMSATQALSISLMVNALGQREFPDLMMTGGTLFGMPVIISEYLQSQGSPGTGMIIMVNASDIFLADDGQVTIDVSREASLEMLDSSLVQNGTTGTGTSLVSLWQSNLIGIRAEREITWKLRRAAGVAYISGSAYVA